MVSFFPILLGYQMEAVPGLLEEFSEFVDGRAFEHKHPAYGGLQFSSRLVRCDSGPLVLGRPDHALVATDDSSPRICGFV